MERRAIGIGLCRVASPVGIRYRRRIAPVKVPGCVVPGAPASCGCRWIVCASRRARAFFVAAEKGYFAAQALDVEPQTFRSAAEMIAPLGAGQLGPSSR